MAHCRRSMILLLLLSLSLFPFIIHGGANSKENHNPKHKHHALIQKTCKISAKTDPNIDYAFCVSALKARPARQCATLRRIGTTCIELIMANVTDTRRRIRAAAKGGKVRRRLRRCVDECYEHYADAALAVGDALRYYKRKKYGDANVMISAVMTDATSCEDLFVEGSGDTLAGGCGGGVSPFSARNNATFQLSAMALSVMDLIIQEGNKVH